MSCIFYYKSIALVIIHSRILYATLYIPKDESQSVDIMNDATKQTNDRLNHDFLLLTVYDDEIKKSYINYRNVQDVMNKISSQSINKNSDLQEQTSSSEINNSNDESDGSVEYPLRSYPPSVQHNLDQAEDMSQYVHSLNNWYESRLKTVTVNKETTAKDDTVTEGNTVKEEDSISEGNADNGEDTATEGCAGKNEDEITEDNMMNENDTTTESVKEINSVSVSKEKLLDTSIFDNNERIRKLRNYYDQDKKPSRYLNLALRQGPSRQRSRHNNIKRQKKTKNRKLRFRTNRNSKGKVRHRLSGILNTTNLVENTTLKTTTKKREVQIFTREDPHFIDKAEEDNATRILSASRHRRHDKIMAFLKDNMMSTMYIYHELKRIEKTHEVRDQIRKMIWTMEHPFYQKQNFAENLLKCYKNYFKKFLQETTMWDKPTNNLVQYIVQDYMNDGL